MESCIKELHLRHRPQGTPSVSGPDLDNRILFFFFNKFIYLFIFGCVGLFVAVRGLSLVAASGGYSSLR